MQPNVFLVLKKGRRDWLKLRSKTTLVEEAGTETTGSFGVALEEVAQMYGGGER